MNKYRVRQGNFFFIWIYSYIKKEVTIDVFIKLRFLWCVLSRGLLMPLCFILFKGMLQEITTCIMFQHNAVHF
jgi:hypothetical protein